MAGRHGRRRPRILWIFGAAWLACASQASAQPTAAELFDDSRLHTLELTVHSRDWDDLKAAYELNTYYPADVSWNDVRVRNVGVRSRGNGSRSGDKPGLELEFDYYVSGQKFSGLRSLVLDNLITDPSMLREAVATAFLRRVGVPASRESFARLVVNGAFMGLYAMVEPVDRGFAREAFGAPGLLFEFRWRWPFYETYLGDDLEPYMTLFASRNGSAGSAESLYGPIRELFRALNATADGDVMDVDRVLDLSGVVKLLAADAFMAELDGAVGYDGMNNIYLYAIGDRAHFIPWDKDHAFWDASRSVLASTDHVLMAKVLATPALKQQFLDTVEADAAAAVTDSWLEETIARSYNLIRDSALADHRKQWENEEFEAGVAALLDFARTRPAVVQGEIQRLR
jgi:spore coat protein CotH